MSLSTSIWLLLGYQLISLRPNPTFQVGVCIEQGCSWGSEYHYHKHHGDVCEWKLQTSEDAVGRGGSGGGAWDLTSTNLASQGPTKGSEGSFSLQTALVSPLSALTSLSAPLQGRHSVSEQRCYPREPISSQHPHSCSASPGTQLPLASSELPEHQERKGSWRGARHRGQLPPPAQAERWNPSEPPGTANRTRQNRKA